MEMNETIENISFPSNLKIIDRSAFAGCSNIITLNLPNTLKEIKTSVVYSFSY